MSVDRRFKPDRPKPKVWSAAAQEEHEKRLAMCRRQISHYEAIIEDYKDLLEYWKRQLMLVDDKEKRLRHFSDEIPKKPSGAGKEGE